jgi:sirohydrochlorin cobaltochelatase
VLNDSFQDAALVLIGHGSTVSADSAAPTLQHARQLRGRRIFAEVHEAFWKQQPSISSALSRISAPRVFLVPLFISEGYFSEEAIPLELGFRKQGEAAFSRIRQAPNQLLFYCRPLGMHPAMTEVVLARAREVIDKHPFPRAPRPDQTALFLAGHGTDRNENSRKTIEWQAELIRQRNLYSETHAVFMEESPRIDEAYSLAKAPNIVMIPFFISDGLHSYQDIPMLLGEPERVVRARVEQGQPTWRNPTGRKGKLLWYGRSVGTEPGLSEVILQRVREAATSS